jgi:hypothetical protein
VSTPASALGFLTGTTTPVSSQAQNQSQTSTQLPDWYTNYTQQILNTAAQFAAQPYQTYQGPRIASQSPLTQSAYSGANSLIPQAGAAATTANNLLTSATQQPSPLQAAQPNLNSAAGLYSSATNPANSGLAAASPYLASAANPTYNTVQQYLNPYTQDVAQNIATLGAQNFNENIMPALTNSFASAGNITGGSTQEANLAQQAARNEQQAVSQAQGSALAQGFQGAQQAAQAGAQTQAQLGATAGALGTANQNALLGAGSGLASLGATAGSLAGTGTQLGLAGATDASLIGGQNINNQTNALNATNALGQQQQAYGQSNLNLAYQDYLNQLYYPMQQVSALQTGLQGIQVPTAINNTGLQTNYGQAASPLNQFLSAIGAFNGLTGTATGAPATTSTPTSPTTGVP